MKTKLLSRVESSFRYHIRCSRSQRSRSLLRLLIRGRRVSEFRNNEFVNLYSLGNSSLESALPGSSERNYVHVDDSVTIQKEIYG